MKASNPSCAKKCWPELIIQRSLEQRPSLTPLPAPTPCGLSSPKLPSAKSCELLHLAEPLRALTVLSVLLSGPFRIHLPTHLPSTRLCFPRFSRLTAAAVLCGL